MQHGPRLQNDRSFTCQTTWPLISSPRKGKDMDTFFFCPHWTIIPTAVLNVADLITANEGHLPLK